MREAVGDSLFNYMLGEKTKIDPQEELFKRYRSLGYDDNQMFRLMKVIDTTNLINREKILMKEQEPKLNMYKDLEVNQISLWVLTIK